MYQKRSHTYLVQQDGHYSLISSCNYSGLVRPVDVDIAMWSYYIDIWRVLSIAKHMVSKVISPPILDGIKWKVWWYTYLPVSVLEAHLNAARNATNR